MRQTGARIYLLIFIAAIIGWIVLSTIGFMNLTGERGNEIPEWLREWSPLGRGIFLNATFNIYYALIALGLFIEFLKPKIEFSRSADKRLKILGIILILNALVVGWRNGLFFGNPDGLIDTAIYGFGFGVLFAFTSPQRTLGLSIALWTRLIEMGGLAIGYFFLPGLFGLWKPGYALGHVVNGPLFMFTSYYFWTDYITAIGSLIGVVILLRKFGFSRFWIASFLIGAIIVGFCIAKSILANF